MMKRVLCICIMLWAVAQAQVPEQYLGNPNNRVVTKGQHKVDSIFFAPNRTDTTFNPGLPAALIFRAPDKHFYFYDGTAWKRLLQIGDAANPTWGTITGNLPDQIDLNNALGLKVPTSRTMTINGITLDLSANRSWSVGDVLTTGSYANPSWITSLAWLKISSTPTTISGYGITDAVSLTGSQTLTNKTLTSPIINLGSDATGDLYYRNSGGLFTRLPVGSSGQVLSVSGGLPSWQPNSGTDTQALKSIYLPLFPNSSKTVSQNGFQVSFRGGVTTFDSLKLLPKIPLALPNSDSVFAFGHSVVAGFNATVPDSNFASIVAKYHNLPLNNKGVGGSYIWATAQGQQAYLNYPHRAYTIYMSTINDLRLTNILTPANRSTIQLIINCYKSMWLNHFAKTAIGASDVTVTRSGTWTTSFNAATNGGKKTNGAFSSTAGDYAEWTTIDSSIAVQFMGRSTAAASNVTISIDGSTVASGINLNAQTNALQSAYVPVAFVFTGLSYASHTIRVTNTGGGAAMYVDYFTSLNPVSASTPFTIFHDTKQDATGYGSGSQASDAAYDTINAKIDSLVATTPAPWLKRTFVAKSDLRFIANTVSGLSSTDHIHPNNLGMKQIASTEALMINAALSDTGRLDYGGYANGYFYGSGKALAYKDSIGLQDVITNNNYLPNPVNINGVNSLNFNNFSSVSIGAWTYTPGATPTAYTAGFVGCTGPLGGLIIGDRTNTGKGFSFYSTSATSNPLAIFDVWKQRNVMIFDTSLRVGIVGNTTSSLTPTANLHLHGNPLGTPGHTSLKIGKSLLVSTPEQYAWENDSLYVTWTNGTSGSPIRDTFAFRQWVKGNFFTQGGNSFGAAARIGTNDANNLNIVTNGTQQLQIQTTIPTGAATDSVLVINSTVLKKVARTTTSFINTVSTTDATPTTISTIAVPTGGVVIVDVDITFAAGTDRSSFCRKFRVKNISGTLTVLNTSTIGTDYTGDAPLSTSTVSATASGTNLLIQVTGVAATSGTWTANGNYKTE